MTFRYFALVETKPRIQLFVTKNKYYDEKSSKNWKNRRSGQVSS